MKKLYPPHLSQIVFLNRDEKLQKINGLDYDLFIWLIYHTHKAYNYINENYVEFGYQEIRESFKSNPNTKSIKSSLEKIESIQLKSNYLGSYGDRKQIQTKQPFKIEIFNAKNGKSYGFGVRVSKKFLGWFDNPKPKVEVNYDIIFGLKKMSKLLYLFLKDALGVYANKNRNVDIGKLKDMMNVCNEKTSNSNFIAQMKKSIEDINDHSDIRVKCTISKKRNPISGLYEIKNMKFIIKKAEWSSKSEKKEESKSYINELTFETYLEDRIEKELKKSNAKIKNITSYTLGIKRNLIKDGIEDEFKIEQILSAEKEKLKSRIEDDQPYMIVLRHIDEEYQIYYINEEYLLVDFIYKNVVTKSKSETLETIHEMFGMYCFDKMRCSYENKYKVGRI
ncbi:hypothetical protein [uncultured Desulfobacter sp.]|uniref:hypothetical protein n=1 Tax=uncultured Desulfobacter sp. TaxID=240139 RepID=UPI0029C65FB8|nr:hypothetical protein [uncultured Desulfobacter sp.]